MVHRRAYNARPHAPSRTPVCHAVLLFVRLPGLYSQTSLTSSIFGLIASPGVGQGWALTALAGIADGNRMAPVLPRVLVPVYLRVVVPVYLRVVVPKTRGQRRACGGIEGAILKRPPPTTPHTRALVHSHTPTKRPSASSISPHGIQRLFSPLVFPIS